MHAYKEKQMHAYNDGIILAKLYGIKVTVPGLKEIKTQWETQTKK